MKAVAQVGIKQQLLMLSADEKKTVANAKLVALLYSVRTNIPLQLFREPAFRDAIEAAMEAGRAGVDKLDTPRSNETLKRCLADDASLMRKAAVLKIKETTEYLYGVPGFVVIHDCSTMAVTGWPCLGVCIIGRDRAFEVFRLSLGVMKVSGSHTAPHIADCIQEMFLKLGIPVSKVARSAMSDSASSAAAASRKLMSRIIEAPEPSATAAIESTAMERTRLCSMHVFSLTVAYTTGTQPQKLYAGEGDGKDQAELHRRVRTSITCVKRSQKLTG